MSREHPGIASNPKRLVCKCRLHQVVSRSDLSASELTMKEQQLPFLLLLSQEFQYPLLVVEPWHVHDVPLNFWFDNHPGECLERENRHAVPAIIFSIMVTSKEHPFKIPSMV